MQQTPAQLMQFKFKITAVSMLALLALLAVIAWTHWHRMNEKYYDFKYRNYDKHSFPVCNRIKFGEEIKRNEFLNDIEVWAKIVDVYDGDTYFAIFEMPRHSIGMYKIRLRKVNAPELDSKRRNEQINAHHCKHTVTNALINKTVHLVLVGKDHYGRMLADVRINGTTDLGEFLMNTERVKVVPRRLWMGS